MPHRADWIPFAGTLVFFAAAAGLTWWDGTRRASVSDAPVFRLHAIEQDGRIRVDWDPSDAVVKKARSATLVARDGNASHEYPVTADALRSGGLDYLRRTNNVLLTLRLEGTGVESAVRTVVSPPRAAEIPPQPQPVATRARRR